MGRSAIPHVVLAIAAMICATVLAITGHADAAYVAFGLTGLGGVAAAAVTVPAGTPGTASTPDLAPILSAVYRAMGSQPAAPDGGPPEPPDVIPPPPPAVTP